MYKKLTIWSSWLLLFAAGTAAAELKIAVLDTQRALVESEEAQALLAQAQEELQAEQDQLQALNEDLKEAMDMDDDVEGVLIAEVLDDSPAEEAGLEDGDVVTAIDGEEMDSVKELVEAIRDRSPGDEVRIDILRDGRRRTVKAELGESEMEYKVKTF